MPKDAEVDGLANTGAQICTAGEYFLIAMGIDVDFLLSTRMGVKGDASSKVTISGAIFQQISAGTKICQDGRFNFVATTPFNLFIFCGFDFVLVCLSLHVLP